MKTDINKLLAMPIMEEWAQFTPVANMTPQEVNTFFTRMLACEKYDNDQGELYELKEAVKSWDHVKECNIGYLAKWGAVKEVRTAILDALADCWYFGFQWHGKILGNQNMARNIRDWSLIKENMCVFETFNSLVDHIKYKPNDGLIKIANPWLHSKFLTSIIHTANHYNFPLHTAVERVHASNLSKRNDKGVFEYNEHGKIIKGKNYVPPVLDDLV